MFLEIVSIISDDFVLAEVSANVWEHGDISTIKSDIATNTQADSLTRLLNHFIWRYK